MPTTNLHSRGFTLIEILIVVLVIGLLAAVGLPIYQGYVARSHASELVIKYDAIRTNIQVAAKTGDVQTACAKLVSTVNDGHLHSDFAQLAIGFEPVTSGYTPVLTMCANLASQGQKGVDVTREAHNLLSRNTVISPGAVIGNSTVSFSVKLAGDSAICKILPPANPGNRGCAQSTASQPLVKPPVMTPSQPLAGNTLATGVGAGSQPGASGPKVCPVTPPRQIARAVMLFGSGASGRVTNAQNLDTHGDMTSFSAEAVITGHTQNSPTATLMSYDTDRPYTGFSLWGPQALHIGVAQMHYNTGINVEDGKDHRLTVTWQQAGGTLVLYDNGREVWRRQGVNTGGTVRGNGKLMIGQVDESAIWGPGTYKDGYSGSIVAASLANTAVSGSQVAGGTLANELQGGNSLITQVVMGTNGQPVDTTGHSSYITAGDVRADSATVNSAVYVDSKCQ